MNVNTTGATPMHEEVIHRGSRVFAASPTDPWPLWFEKCPGAFVPGRSWKDVGSVEGEGIQLSVARELFGPFTDVTADYPRP